MGNNATASNNRTRQEGITGSNLRTIADKRPHFIHTSVNFFAIERSLYSGVIQVDIYRDCPRPKVDPLANYTITYKRKPTHPGIAEQNTVFQFDPVSNNRIRTDASVWPYKNVVTYEAIFPQITGSFDHGT
jgi:hypothetical protein